MKEMNDSGKLYTKVILPLKLSNEISYYIPDELKDDIIIGSRVYVTLVNRKYIAIVAEITEEPDYDPKKIRAIDSVLEGYVVDKAIIEFWRSVAGYYMCSVGEVYRAAYPAISGLMASVKRKVAVSIKTDISTDPNSSELSESYNSFVLPDLSSLQQKSLEEIEQYHSKKQHVLLNGVTGSGKTEIYIHLIAKTLGEGRDVLYMLPEVAVSRQLTQRLKKVFGDQLLIYHSGETKVQRRRVIEALANEKPYLILGLRSSLFLPLENTGLIIIDEEQDNSYKQVDPAPRYNARDTALLFASHIDTNILMGSATPSFESLYSISAGKLKEVRLTEKYHKGDEAELEILDMREELRKRKVKGIFSLRLIEAVKKCVDAGEQAVIFRARRAYSPIVQCDLCGYIPKCPNCNIHYSYHKFNNSLTCHYCGHAIPYFSVCQDCGGSIIPLGSGTEKVEEELREIFPEYRIARFDADTTRNRRDQERILREFAAGEIDILVGTQMISKGFDFQNLSLAAVIQAETLAAINDFRSDEKVLQLILQLRGRVGRRGKRGRMIIQTGQPDHAIFRHLSQESEPVQGIVNDLLYERKEFNYPPYSRLIRIIVKDRNQNRAFECASRIAKLIDNLEYQGPVVHSIERIQQEYIYYIWLKVPRNRESVRIKRELYSKIESIVREKESASTVLIDVDPYGDRHS